MAKRLCSLEILVLPFLYSMTALATKLGVSVDTTRRDIRKLMAMGSDVKRGPGGWSATKPVFTENAK
jgi:predicted DNA-binding transcriptional regulator YafY